MSEATSAVDEAIPEAPPEDTQLAFDVHAFPGGVRGALEAVLMVVDEPLSAVALASALEVPVPDVEAELAAMEEEYAAQFRGFSLRRVGDGWRSRRSRSSPTASRCPGPACRPCGGSTSTA